MGLFSGLTTRISNAVASVKQAFRSAFREKESFHSTRFPEETEAQWKSKNPDQLFGVIQKGIPGTIAVGDALLSVFVRGADQEMLRAMADEGLDAAVRALEPISRSGATARSLRVTSIPGGFAVVSDAPQAYALLSSSAMQSTPPIGALLDWMATKPESFGGLESDELLSVAFAIRTSIATGAGRGSTGESDLARLSPYGERSFDYVQEAIDQLGPVFENFGVVVSEIID